MNRLPLAVAAIAASLTLIVGTTDAHAQSPTRGAYYVAVPQAPAGKSSLITGSTPWTLRGAAYVANRAPERGVVLCQLLARNVGRLQSFSVAGAALDGVALDKCNSRARATAGAAMAAR